MVHRTRTGSVLAAAVLCLLGANHAAPSRALIAVDLELVLAVDTSASVDPIEYELQAKGLLAALRDPAVIAAVRGTGPSGIAVTVVHWSSAHEQRQVVPWRQLTGPASVRAFADAVAENSRRSFSGSTGIGEVLRYGERLIRRNRFEGRRKSIDVSGDGSNNSGVPPGHARPDVVAGGVTVNGLTILTDEPFLHRYFEQNVIGGPGAFVMSVASYRDFVSGMRKKLLREIAVTVSEAGGPAGADAAPGRR